MLIVICTTVTNKIQGLAKLDTKINVEWMSLVHDKINFHLFSPCRMQGSDIPQLETGTVVVKSACGQSDGSHT